MRAITEPLHPLLRIAEIRDLEVAAQAGTPPGTLMARAGAAAADLAIELLGLNGASPGPVCVLVGPGNNGGDALVTARLLMARGVPVQLFLLDAPEHFQGEARDAWLAWVAVHGAVFGHEPDGLEAAGLVVDGLFGIGLNRPMPERARAWVALVDTVTCPVLALDVPSGVNADTGVAHGRALRATHTLTFMADKPGLHTLDGPDHAGVTRVADLGVATPSVPGRLNAVREFADMLRPRGRNSHKGSFGSVGVIGGNQGMAGAGLLSARMALQGGAGRVYLQRLGADALACDLLQPELMLRDDLADAPVTALVIGPGLGQPTPRLQDLLTTALARAVPAVVDADALNAIAAVPALRAAVLARAQAAAPVTILTPHPLEAARLLGATAAQTQADRVASALTLAARHNAVIVLKGNGSIIAAPDGRWAVNPTGNAGLATAGSGDVLSGLIGALLAQGWPAWQAALGAVWMHGAAADALVAQGIGPIGLTASELMPAIRRVLNGLVRDLNAAGPATPSQRPG